MIRRHRASEQGRRQALRALPLQRLAAALAIVVAGCAGDPGGDSGVGSGGTGFAGTQTGSVSGFGSVIVEGIRYDDSAARYSVDIDPATPRSGTASDARLGMQVEVSYDGSDRAQSVSISAEAIGPVDRLTADGFVVAGQTVRVSTSPPLPTVLAGLAGAGELAVGDRVEVYGQRDAAGVVIATRVARVDAGGTGTRVVGTVVAADAAARTVQIGELVIAQGAGTQVLPAGTALAAGQRVAVWSSGTPSTSRLSASTLRVLRPSIGDSQPLRAGGPVRGLERGTLRFRIGELEVDASGAAFVGGAASELADGRIVRVRGTGSGGRLRATEVQYLQGSGDARVEITGVIQSFADPSSFVVRGAPVDASAAGVEFRNGAAANLADGVLVRLEGSVSSGVLRATRVELLTGPDERTRAFLGTVSSYQPGTGEFQILGVPMRLAPGATFVNADGSAAHRGDFGVDVTAEVDGRFVGGVFVVDAVALRSLGLVRQVRAEGSAYGVDLAARTLIVNGIAVRWTPFGTRIDGSLSDLRGGTPVRVEGSVAAGVLVATRLTIRP